MYGLDWKSPVAAAGPARGAVVDGVAVVEEVAPVKKAPRDVDAELAEARRLLEAAAPVLYIARLHFGPDYEEPLRCVDSFLDRD